MSQTFDYGVLLSGLSYWKNRYKCAALEAFVELHRAISCCKDRVIFTKANALAWPELCAALANDDVSRNNRLAT